MRIVFSCPGCDRTLRIKTSRSGKKVRCPCGEVVRAPPVLDAETNTFIVRCSECEERHEVDASMAGQWATCRCGHRMQVPMPAGIEQGLSGIADVPFDETDFGAMPYDDLAGDGNSTWEPPPSPSTAAEAPLESAGDIFGYALSLATKGMRPSRIRKALIARGLSPDEAASVMRTVTPDDQLERSDNRRRGLGFMYSGGLTLLIAVLTGVLTALWTGGTLVLVAVGLFVAGLFQLLVGIVMAVTGVR